ncbi:unnamed protein product [Chrysodeixis includens]|uniref:trypsin n=1 Tax=Chrysodeixis includens TaxID=689277 RepID=A0A9P0FVC2_CHRIL|nr:unnamed protein product [Chrysodeixis includens]
MKPAAALLVFLFSAYFVNSRRLYKPDHVGIIGGHSIAIENAPYVVSLRLNGSYHWCGGSIIHEQFVLTAAHCMVPHREFKVRVGADKVDEGGKLYDVEKKIIHPKYNNLTSDYDICILKLNESLSFGPKVNKIALNDRKVKLRSRVMLNATGWGYTQPEGKVSQYLRQVTIPVVETFLCQLIYGLNNRITHRMFCAGGNGKDTCSGDSGGPITKDNIQVGVTSFGSGCGKIPGVYAKISVFNKWIKKTIEES